MRKAAVRHGDPTSTHGIVMAYSSTIQDGGKRIALSDDEATCGNCEGMHKIRGTAQRMSEQGRPVVLDGDLVLCPCGQNRVIVGDNPRIWVIADEGPSDGILDASSAAGSSSLAALTFDEQIRVAVSRTTLEGYPYLIETADGQTFMGHVSADGKLPRVATGTSAGEYAVYWGDDALARQGGC